MKKKLFPIAILTAVLAGCFTANNIFALSTTPGTATDPLVSKSYVDNKFNELSALISNASPGTVTVASDSAVKDQVLAEVMDQLEIFYADSGLGSNNSRYIPVFVNAGQVVLGGEGTEIILRSGLAKGYIPGENGIVNATDGTEVFNDTVVKINNLLIVPREDGRGVAALTDAWFLIKGSYDLVN